MLQLCIECVPETACLELGSLLMDPRSRDMPKFQGVCLRTPLSSQESSRHAVSLQIWNQQTK